MNTAHSMSKPKTRNESEILSELEKVCTLPGYVHAITYLCFRDNFIAISADNRVRELRRPNSPERLIRTEITTLIGLMVKAEMNLTFPGQKILGQQLQQTEQLLHELHESMAAAFFAPYWEDRFDPTKDNPFLRGQAMKEPIFYSAESAYIFQYADFTRKKYESDNDWLSSHKGFTIDDAINVASAICKTIETKITEVPALFDRKNSESWNLLPAFTFNITEIIEASRCSQDTVRNVVKAFSLTSIPCNQDFKEIGDFNRINATPIISLDGENYLLFQGDNLMEALYESPFYWMGEDKEYCPTLMANRGNFTETFLAKKLKMVFREAHVFQNLRFVNALGRELGEIDVLVIYSDRAIICQAKSKRLSIPARKGNDSVLQKDFQEAVQKAYDQGWKCATYILDEAYAILDEKGNKLNLRRLFREVFIFCVLSDHYPALNFQAKQFLKHQNHPIIRPPYVMDIFFIDLLTEFLKTPLHFLSYIHKRAEYFETIISNSEIVILSYHLKQNLWFGKEYNIIQLDDGIATDLDVAMRVRREGFPGKDTPDGILTKYKGHPYGEIIDHVSTNEQDGILDLGFFLLSLDEKTALFLGETYQKIRAKTRTDFKPHDFTFTAGGTGFTLHCSYDSYIERRKRLEAHCEMRKYSQKSNLWFGLSNHAALSIPFEIGLMMDSPWEQSAEMEAIVKEWEEAANRKPFKNPQAVQAAMGQKESLGRNDLCPCGSKKKFKRCCYQ